MISGLIDELNKSADEWNGSNMFELARMCREAADTIWQLRDDLQRANDAVQDAEHDESRAWDRVRKAEYENAKLREQMERLVTLLRADCDIEASWDGLRKFWSIGLTENGCLMRDRACKAEAENAKLRESVKRLMTQRDERLARAEAENAKLRELVSGLEYCVQGFDCDCCPLYDPSGTNHRRCESLERELGIEVDE